MHKKKPAGQSMARSEERLKKMMNISGVGVLIFDSGGYLIEANDAFLAMTGYTPEQIAARQIHWRIMTPPQYIPRSEQEMRKLAKTGRIGPYEKEYFRRDGSRSWMHFAGASLGDGTVVEYCIDISDRKKVEAELRASKAAAEEANRVKDAFLATLSHELRTPLGAILLWTKILEGKTVTPEQVREGISAIKLSAEAQKELIEDLLDMSRITTGNLRLKPRDIDLLPVIRDALDAIKPAASARDIALRARLDDHAGVVHADPDRLRQIVWNLLTNAVKFTPPGGKVDVALKRRNDDVEIRVADSGAGIGPDFLPYVFQPFRQAETSNTRSISGIGLGLAIARQLVELHGGAIVPESAGLGKGATFTVRLPLPVVKDRRPRAGAFTVRNKSRQPSRLANLAGATILFVDDDRETRGALNALFTRAGMKVLEAGSAEAARKLLRHSLPDILVGDVAMPDEDGYALIRSVRLLEREQNLTPIPAIALTAFARETDKRIAIDAGFWEHIGKPVDFDYLLERINDLLPPRGK